MEIVGFARFGYEGELVKVEADLRRGIPAVDIVGLPDGAVREARERMRAAIRNSGLEFPRDRILINLSPADLRKEGSAFDLPIAIAVLRAAEALAGGDGEDPGKAARASAAPVMILGELELSGAVRPVRGVLSAVSRALEEGVTRFVVPLANEEEASFSARARVIGVASLAEAMHRVRALETEGSPGSGINGDRAPESGNARFGRGEPFGIRWGNAERLPGYEDVRGQPALVRALEIAAAGGHNLLVYGPPGTGKTLALRRFPCLLPELDRETALTVTRIHSIAGLLNPADRTGCAGGLLRSPPFREPHQNASLEGMTGGGRLCHPGEISLAHGGVLYLDEAAQFRTSVLQTLRTPLETGRVTVSRAGRSDTYPARFQLLASLNPCPCGNFGSAGRICTCTPDMIGRYWKRLTAPLLDRIDLRVAAGIPDPESLAGRASFSTAELRDEIGRARMIQWKRNRARTGRKGDGAQEGWLNAGLGPAEVSEACALGAGELKIFASGMEAAGLSGRGGHGVLKVARTIADLEGSEKIGGAHLLEAIQFRRWGAAVPDFL